jgi:DNA-binding Lrp family transcriptional regulator
MLQAYILIQAEVGRADSVAAAIGGIEGITSVAAVSGPYDIIAVIRADNIDDLGRLVMGKIQPAQGITRTLTCPIVRP